MPPAPPAPSDRPAPPAPPPPSDRPASPDPGDRPGPSGPRVQPAPLVLASASPARLGLLRAAGIEPEVIVSAVDEEALAAELGADGPVALVEALARAKARDVAGWITDGSDEPVAGRLVLGCDSMFELDGEVWGKPGTVEEAADRIHRQRGRAGLLHTGHVLIDGGSGAEASEVVTTTVRFGPMTDAEVDAYVATGEPLRVAGSFTLDGRSAPFVEGIDGDHTNVIGLSLPAVRRLLAALDHSVVELWSDP